MKPTEEIRVIEVSRKAPLVSRAVMMAREIYTKAI